MGVTSIRNTLVNEIMHNPVGPWAEANALYIEQSGLNAKLLHGDSSELVIFDVGLGAAANAIAALACAKNLKEPRRPLRIVSFERELELLRFALSHSDKFDHFKGFETAIETLLSKGKWTDNQLSWELRHGDFLEQINVETSKPHLIFFDPYSPKVNEDMWTTECFRRLRRKSREVEEGGTILYTYSRATRIRTAMIAGGFYVGYGQATGLKDETTQASTDLKLLAKPVGQEWISRWEKSHLRYPFDCTAELQSEIDQLVKDYQIKIGL